MEMDEYRGLYKVCRKLCKSRGITIDEQAKQIEELKEELSDVKAELKVLKDNDWLSTEGY